MDTQGKKGTHDALDEILKRYLLEHDAANPEGEGLMEMAASSVLAIEPTITPSPDKEAEMLKKLQEAFPELPQPGPTTATPMLKYGIFGIAALTLVTMALLLFLNPFGEKQATSNNNPYPNEIESGQGLSNNVELPIVQNGNLDEDFSSLQNGDGNPLIDLNASIEVGTGKGIRNRKVRRNLVEKSDLSAYDNAGFDSRTGSNASQQDPEDDDYVFPARDLDPFPLRDFYAQTVTQSAFIQLDPNTDHLIKASKGTILHIPKNAFVDASSGESVSKTVQLEIKEIYSRSEYINSNISTFYNGQQMIGGGVVYIDATSAGRRLELAGDKNIYIEYANASKEQAHEMQLFHGVFDKHGELDLENSGAKFNKLVPLPLEKLYFDEFWCDCSSEKLWNRQWVQLFSPEFENSWIATREFRQRLRVLRDMGYYEPGFQIYLDNTDKELWRVDKMVAEKLKSEAAQRKTKNDEVDYFNRFSQQMLTFAESFNDYGIDLLRQDARRQLLYRKVSKEETERLIRLAKLRDNFVKEVESRLILTENGKFQGTKKGKYEKAGSNLIAGFLINRLGWNMINKVAGDDYGTGKNREIKVRLTGNIAYESTRAFLVFGTVNSILPGKMTTGQLFRFKKIPALTDAWIVAIGFKNSMPYLGILPVSRDRGGDKVVEIEMEETRFDAFFAALRNLD